MGNDGFYWGFPDGVNHFGSNSVNFEIESGQHHPDTNVLKYWPVLEENPLRQIIPIQWLIKKPRSKNRWELSKFVGNKMMQTLGGQFIYISLEYDNEENDLSIAKAKELIARLQKQ